MIAREHLDQLDALLDDGADLPWRVAHPFLTVIDTGDAMSQVETDHTYDAALIVAAVNALPQLTAALRAVLKLADKWESLDRAEQEQWEAMYEPGTGGAWGEAADSLRTVIAEAFQ